MIITISGMPGAGKGTAAALLAKRLNYPVYSIGDIRRSLARSRGMTLAEFNTYGETHPETDLDVDLWQGRMAKKIGRGIFEGRVSYAMIPQSIRIYLACSIQEGARRIMQDQQEKRKFEADHGTYAKTVRSIRRRLKSDRERYRRYYGLDIHDRTQYDLVINTTKLQSTDVQRKIHQFLTESGFLAKNKDSVNQRWKEWQLAHRDRVLSTISTKMKKSLNRAKKKSFIP